MFYNSSSENYLSSLFCTQRNIIDLSYITSNVANESFSAFFIRHEVHAVSDCSISQCWRKDWNIIFVAPIVNAFFFIWKVIIIQFFAHSINDIRGSKYSFKSWINLLLMQLSEKWLEPCFEHMIVMIRNDKISCSIQTLISQCFSI